ncbi:lipoprotein [Streptomyces olivochromogenes]|uniref:Lipoprotein n=1 Tax=Streptomyces olivochromogenes TaxID=1963 RepID=A0A250VU85_STROL|nr:lipoprotein [Streptomyces olivochromogenes]
MKGMAAATVPAVPVTPLAAASGCPGRTLYLPEAVESTTPTGGGACASAWPSPLASGTPKAAPFGRRDLISTSKRSNGITQVTRTGHGIRQQGRTRLIGDR